MILRNNLESLLYNKSDFDRFYDSDKVDYRKGGRDDFERDYGRIIHSSAFRRLQGKTQVFGPSEGDFHRTRLTHTLEVSQIARGITIHLNTNVPPFNDKDYHIDVSLIEAGALAHDLGHPPYGHQGERALNKCMKNYGGFEGNAHTFRLLTRLEGDGEKGLNLTRATLLSIIKYPIIFDDANSQSLTTPPKSSVFKEDTDIWNWIINELSIEEKSFLLENDGGEIGKHKKTTNKSLECSIIELADDIAYATHDLQDVLKFRLMDFRDFEEYFCEFLEKSSLDKYKDKLLLHDNNLEIDHFIANLIHTFIKGIEIREENFENQRLKYRAVLPPDLRKILDHINENIIYKRVITGQRVQTLEWKGNVIISKLFNAFMETPLLLPENRRYKINDKEYVKARKVCDYIAGMTDKYAENFYKRLYEAGGGRLFDL